MRQLARGEIYTRGNFLIQVGIILPRVRDGSVAWILFPRVFMLSASAGAIILMPWWRRGTEPVV